MSARQKLIEKWRTCPPTEESFNTVRSVLEYYGFTVRSGGRHHVAHHDGLRDHPDFPMGQICIPTVKGRTVKGYYLRNIVVAFEYLGVFEDD